MTHHTFNNSTTLKCCRYCKNRNHPRPAGPVPKSGVWCVPPCCRRHTLHQSSSRATAYFVQQHYRFLQSAASNLPATTRSISALLIYPLPCRHHPCTSTVAYISTCYHTSNQYSKRQVGSQLSSNILDTNAGEIEPGHLSRSSSMTHTWVRNLHCTS